MKVKSSKYIIIAVIILFVFQFIFINSSSAFTKGFEVMLMNSATDGGPYYSVWGSENLKKFNWNVGTLATYSYRPMQLYQNGSRVRGILDNTVVQHVYGQFGIVDRWLSLGVDIPIGWWADFRDPNVAGATNQNKLVIGDIYLNFKSELVKSKYFGLAIRPFISIPTGYAKEFFGNGNVTGGGTVIAEVKPLDRWHVSLNTGVQAREKFNFRDIEKSHQLELGFGTALQIVKPISIVAEIVSTTRLSGIFSEKTESPVEARGGIKWKIGNSGFLANIGGGAGILRGTGAPTYRIFAGLGFSPTGKNAKKQKNIKHNYDFLKNYTIYFDTDSAEIDEIDSKKLTELSDRIRNDNVRIKLEGYGDSIGNEEINNRLSKRRSEKVGWFLNLMGIEYTRMEILGMGDTNPVGSNKSEKGRAKNRRVEISVIQ